MNLSNARLYGGLQLLSAWGILIVLPWVRRRFRWLFLLDQSLKVIGTLKADWGSASIKLSFGSAECALIHNGWISSNVT